MQTQGYQMVWHMMAHVDEDNGKGGGCLADFCGWGRRGWGPPLQQHEQYLKQQNNNIGGNGTPKMPVGHYVK